MSETLEFLVEGYDSKKAEEVKTGQRKENWEDVYAARQNGTILQGEIIGLENIANMTCGIIYAGGVKGILPMELAGAENIRQMRRLVGQKVAFKVIRIEKAEDDEDKFIASRTAALEHMANITWGRIEQGDEVIAVVRNVRQKRILLDVGGIQVNMRAEEYDYGFIDDLNDHLQVGDHLKVQVTELNKEEKKISVSRKVLQTDSWNEISKQYHVYGEYVGEVTGTTEFGVFVNLKANVDCLTPHPRFERMKKGDKVLVRLLNINSENRRIRAKLVRKL